MISEPVPVATDAMGGLAAILDDDIFLIKEEKVSKSSLERAIKEVNRYKELPQIKVGNNLLKWREEHCVYFPHCPIL